jgi:hypothetical protein
MADMADVRKVSDYPRALADGSVIISANLRSGRRTEPVVVRLTKTRPYFGSERIWLSCPECQRRCGKLYAPESRPVLACRKCHDLVYFLQHRQSASAAFCHWVFYHEGRSRISKKVERVLEVFQDRQERGKRINLAHL